MATQVIGLDFGSREVRAVALAWNYGDPEIRGIFTAPIHIEADESRFEAQTRTARALLEREELAGEVCAMALPQSYLATIHVTLPISDPKLVESYLLNELYLRLPFPVEELIYQYHVTATREDEVDVEVIYLSKDHFEEVFQILKDHNLDPKCLTSSIYPLQQLAPVMENENSLFLILDIGENGSRWLFLHNEDVYRAHQVDVGGAAVTARLARYFKVSHEQAELGKIAEAALLNQEDLSSIDDQGMRIRAEAINRAIIEGLTPLLRELSRSIARVEHDLKMNLSQIYLMGAGAKLPGLPQKIENELDITTTHLPTPFKLESIGHRYGEDPTTYLGAFALARHLNQRRGVDQFNFRTGAYAYRGDAEYIKSAAISLLLAGIVILLSTWWQMEREQDRIRKELNRLDAEISALSTELTGKDLSARALLMKMSASEVPRDLIPSNSALDVLGELSSGVDSSAKIDVDYFKVDLDRNRLEVRGKASSLTEVDLIVNVLQKNPCFSEAVKKDRISKSVDERTSFRITSTSRCK